MKKKTSQVLIDLRKQHGYTQNDLAEKLGVSFQAVSKWERGENLPDAYTLVEIADIYGVSVDEILKGEVIEKESNTKKNQTLLNVLMVIGITLIVLSPVPYLALSRLFTDTIGIIGVLVSVTIGVLLVSISGYKIGRRSHISPKRQRRENIIYGSCAVVFLFTGMMWGVWHIMWIVFVIGWVILEIWNKE